MATTATLNRTLTIEYERNAGSNQSMPLPHVEQQAAARNTERRERWDNAWSGLNDPNPRVSCNTRKGARV